MSRNRSVFPASPAGRIWRGFLLATAVTVGLAAAPTVAQIAPEYLLGDADGTLQHAGADDLIARAEARGRLVVLVGFEADFTPEGRLDRAGVAAQRRAIGAAQGRVLAGLAAPESVARFDTVPYLGMAVTPDDLRRLIAMPGVVWIAEDVPMPPLLSESVPIIEARPLWRRGHDGRGQVIAVLDTGVQLNHTAFEAAVAGGACFSRNIEGITESLCPNGAEQQLTVQAGRACRPLSQDGCEHGTHVAGIAMGDRQRYRGVAPAADVVSMQVFSLFTRASDCAPEPAPCVRSFTSDQIRALQRVQRLHDRGIVPNIAAVNMSLGGGAYRTACDNQSRPLAAAIANLRSRGIPTLVAAGNDGLNHRIASPACISQAIAVGSTTKADAVSGFSNHGRLVELMAPGTDITAPWYRRARNWVTPMSGTSMAAPHVAGAWALLRSSHPDATVNETLRALACTGEPVSRAGLPRPRIDIDAARSFLDDPEAERVWTFRAERQVYQWTHHIGTWFHFRNNMRVVANQRRAFWYMASSPFCGGNLHVEARIRRTQPVDDPWGWTSGLYLHSNTDPQAMTTSGLFFSFTAFGGTGGAANIWAVDALPYGGGTLIDRNLCEARGVGAIDPDGFNLLRVESEDGHHRFFINGTPVCSAFDPAFVQGDVSVVMAAPGNAPAHRMDVASVRVVALDGPGEAAGAGMPDPAGDAPAGSSALRIRAP